MTLAAMRTFVGIDLGLEAAPDETTVCKFRHLLEAHNLGEQLFTMIAGYLDENGMKVSRGTIVDATIIDAPTSTKNRRKERDPEMHQTKKGQPVVFRHEGPHWRRQPHQADPFGGGHGGERTRQSSCFPTFSMAMKPECGATLPTPAKAI